MKKAGTAFFMLLAIWAWAPFVATAQSTAAKPRTIVTTDGEVDDVDSFIRLLLYANEFNVGGPGI